MTRKAAMAILLAVSGLAGAAGCGGSPAPSSRQPFTVVRMKAANGQAEVLLEPRGPVKGLVLFEHGYGETQDAPLRTPVLYPLRDALLSNGFAMAASYSHGNNMGNPASIEDQVLLLHDAEARLPAVATVDVVGFSMGGADALMVASRHLIPGLKAVVVLSGVCDQVPFLGTSLGPPLRAAFGNLTGQALIAAITPVDPARQDPRSFAGYKYWFWQSPTDQTVPPSQATTMTARLASAGVPVRFSPLDGGHGDLSELQPERIVQYFES